MSISRLTVVKCLWQASRACSLWTFHHDLKYHVKILTSQTSQIFHFYPLRTQPFDIKLKTS